MYLVNMQVINETFKEINTKFRGCCDLKERMDQEENIEENDGTYEFLKSFFDIVKADVEKTENRIKAIDDEYKKVVSHFGETLKDLPLETLVDILEKFNKALNVLFKMTIIKYIYLFRQANKI